MQARLSEHLVASGEAAQALAGDTAALSTLTGMADVMVACLRAGGKILIAGNGGSAADAQHIAAEFVSRLMFNRPPLAAIALAESAPILTACGNDYGFEAAFARQITALGRAGDVFWGFSTSGNSPNLLAGATAAHAVGLASIGFTGAGGGEMAAVFGQVFRAPSGQGQIVQQLHMMAAHAVLAAIEIAMFGQP